MSNQKANPFSAEDSLLGYLYQVRSAMLWTLRKLKNETNFLVSIETLDDVTFETSGGDLKDLLQTKHHRKQSASLTDASVDLWKSLRIWFEGYSSGSISKNSKLFLITTARASEGSAASFLRAQSRNREAAQEALDATAMSSKNKKNEESYAVYLNAKPAERSLVLDQIIIIDGAPTITDLDGELRQEVFWAVEKEHHTLFLEGLEGWWLRRVLHQLSTDTEDRISSIEVEAQMTDLREQFKQDALPIDENLLNFILDEPTRASHEKYSFVKQLELIKAGKKRIAAAIRDYYRAFHQRSLWLRNDLVIGLELHKYEKRLLEEWELIFEAMKDELGDRAADHQKEKSARSILEWAERVVIPIRTNVNEPFICRGSLHMLADELRIGWHPEFLERLSSLLTPKEKSA